jgi:class 3 adenylate cyclase
MVLNPENDIYTWRIYGITPLLLNFLILWFVQSSHKYVLEVISVTYAISCFGMGFSNASLGGLDGPWLYTMYIIPIVTTFYPFKIGLRILTTFCFTIAINLGYFLGNPEYLNYPHINNIFFTFGMFSIFSIVSGHHVYNLTRDSLLAKKLMGIERDKSENLLINMLPESIADKLKEDTSVIADSFPEASVLFVDIADFTKLSNTVSPTQLVSMLNVIMSKFDDLTHKYGLEKIKTIGDAYMVAGGVPNADDDHANKMAKLALEMLDVISKIEKHDGTHFSARIGINSGEIVAGVIGTKKFIYDLWGDAVNVASRMESHGEIGKIQITEAFHKIIKDDFETEYRGEIEVKGKGLMKTWWLLGKN